MSANTARVSVVIPHYGDPRPATELIGSLRSQAPHEIIVSDDCSPEPFPDTDGVTVIRRPINGGFSAAVNSGVAATTGDQLLVLNSDLEIPADLIQQLSAAGDGKSVVAPRVVRPDGTIDHTVRAWPNMLNQTLEWLTPLARFRQRPWFQEPLGHDPRALTATEPVEVDWLVGAAILVPTADFRAVGGLDERFHMNSEEIDLQRRLAERGVKRIYLPTVSVIHEGGGSSDPGKRRRWLVTSQLRYAGKWGGLKRLRVALTAATGINFVWNGLRRLRGIDVRPVQVAREELSLVWTKI